MSHVLFDCKNAAGMLFMCECGKFMGKIVRPYDAKTQEDVYNIILGHREHARNQLVTLGYDEPGGDVVYIDETLETLGAAQTKAVIDLLEALDRPKTIHTTPPCP
jgi:hypothetical protein